MATAYFRPISGTLFSYYGALLDVQPLVEDAFDVLSLQGEGDVLLRHTPNDGEIEVRNGLLVLQGGLETAVYLSLFGGNEDDHGGSNKTYTWWGNLDEPQSAFHYRARTQHLLQSIVAIPANLRRIEDAVKSDLDWMIREKVASSIGVTASMPGVDQIAISIDVLAQGEKSRFNYVDNWKTRL